MWSLVINFLVSLLTGALSDWRRDRTIEELGRSKAGVEALKREREAAARAEEIRDEKRSGGYHAAVDDL